MIHKFRHGWPVDWHHIWVCYESKQMSRADLEAWMRDDHERQAFIAEMKSDSLAKQCNDFIEGGSDWKARNNSRMNERFDDPWGGM